MLNEYLVVAAAVAVIVGLYLLRHVIALAFRLAALAALVLAGYWAWQNRAALVDAAEPWLGDFGERIQEMNLPDVLGFLDGLDPAEDTAVAEDAGAPADAGAAEDTGDLEEPGAAPDG